MTSVLAVIGIILFVLIVSFGIGWIIAKFKMRRLIKKIDRELNNPDTIKSIQKQLEEQKKVTIEREVRDNERRRAIFRGYGDRGLSPITAGESNAKKPAEYSVSKGADERRDKLQDDLSGKPGENSLPVRRNDIKPEEDWPDFS